MGYRRLITYTLAEEPGTSLRAAGWKLIGELRGRLDEAARPRGAGGVMEPSTWSTMTVEQRIDPDEIAGLKAEIERLREQVTQRRARMQVMREWMFPNDWRHFVITKPEAGEWFDDDGVPR